MCFFFFCISVVNPKPKITTVGGSAHFLCNSARDTLDNISWRANGSNITENKDVIIRISFGRGTLTLHNVPQMYNLTLISCHSLVNGSEITISNQTLLLQGKEVPTPA